MGNTRKGSSPSKTRSKSKGRPRSQSSSGKSPKKTPGKGSPSKSPSRKATPKNKPKVQNNKKVVSKTPTPVPRSRSTSRGRKANTAPAASKSQKENQSRSRSRSRTTTNRKPQLATATVSSGQVTLRQPQRPSSSLSQFLNQQQQGGPRSRGQSSSMNSGSSSLTSSNRSPRGAANKGQGVVKAIWNGTSQKLRKVLNGGYLNTKYWSKTKKHIKGHWKQWLTAILMLLISYFAYTFSKELIASVKQLSQTISEYAEEKRKIFGEYSEQARKYSYNAYENARQSYENAKKAYFSQDPPEIKPFDHVEKPTDVPSHQTTPPTARNPPVKGVDKSKHTIDS